MMKIKNFFIFVASIIAFLFLNSTVAIAGTCLKKRAVALCHIVKIQRLTNTTR